MTRREVGIDHHSLDVSMSEKLLDGWQRHAGHGQVRRKCVAEIMERGAGNARQRNQFLDGPFEGSWRD